MPSRDFWREVPELVVLAAIAAREKMTFALRGSTAQRLTGAYTAKKENVSLFASMPPLSDVDFVVEKKSDAYVLKAALAGDLPASRFYRIDVRTEEELKHYQNAALCLTRQPRIRFKPAPRPDESEETSPRQKDEAVLWLSGEKLLHDVDPALTAEVQIERRKEDVEWSDALTNLCWVARRDPHATDSTEWRSYKEKVLAIKPAKLRSAMRGRPMRAFLFALLKLLLERVSGKQSTEWLDDEYLSRFAEEADNPMLTKLVAFLREPPGAVMAVIVPRRIDGRWLSHIETVEPLTGASGILNVESMKIGQSIPPAPVVTDDPERPGCCRYRDFSRGVTEVAWTGPPPPNDERLTVVTLDDELFLAPSIASTWSDQHAVKVDYGFLCQLSGARRPIDLHYAGVSDVQ